MSICWRLVSCGVLQSWHRYCDEYTIFGEGAEKHHHIVESWLCIEIYVIIEEAWFPDTSLRVCCCQPRTPAKLRSAVSRKICWLKKMCVIWKIIWFIMGSIRSSAEWLTRAQEQSKHCHMSRAREKIGREAKSRFSLCVRKHSTQVTSCRIRNTGTLAWKLSNLPTCCGYD